MTGGKDFDEAEFRRTQVYAAAGPSERIARDLDRIYAIDKAAERRQLLWGVGGLGSTVAAFAVHEPLPALGVLLLPLGIFAFVKAVRGEKHDYEDRRYQLLRRVMGLLARDMPRAGEFAVRLDLRGATVEAKRVGAYAQGDDLSFELYDDPWLDVGAKLADGSRVEVAARERTRRKTISRLNARGKAKVKEKVKTRTLLRVALRPKERRRPCVAALGSAVEGAVRLPAGVRLRSVTYDAGALELEAVVDGPWGPGFAAPDPLHVLALILLSLYQPVNLARKIQHARAAPGGPP